LHVPGIVDVAIAPDKGWKVHVSSQQWDGENYYHGIVSMGGHAAAYPLEAMAYLLQGWFQAKPTAPFFVPGEVERALAHLR
jgi:hypothetical protein